MAAPVVAGALLAGKLATKKALKLLRDHGHKAQVKGDKMKAAYSEGSKGKLKTKINTLPKEPPIKKVRDLLNLDFGKPLHCLIIPGKLHFMEEEMLKLFN